MPRKRTGYDAACYYDGKLLGRCTKADSDAYTLLMNACGGEAARVLREYVGDGMMLHCGSPIQYANINSSYWQTHFYAFGRL